MTVSTTYPPTRLLFLWTEVNTVGLGENTPHHGFTLIIGPSTELTKVDEDGEPEYLQIPSQEDNMFHGGNVVITSLSDVNKR